jgi:hypothetical protein
MKKTFILFILLLFGTGIVMTKAWVASEADITQNEIKSVIEASYINGAFNDLDTKTMREGFLPNFAIHGVQDGALRRYPIDEWIANIEKRKQSPDFDPADQKWDHKFALIDVTGVAAVAKIELFKDGKHIFTDYLSLLRFKEGWKITDKVYHRHPDS